MPCDLFPILEGGVRRQVGMMRSVSLVDRLELEFSGNHFSHGVCLGDVDGDGVSNRQTPRELDRFHTCGNLIHAHAVILISVPIVE